MSDEALNKRYKRKRKKSFLQNARKYAKKEYYGRGSHMDSETYQYFVRILEVYKQGFENDDDRVIFVNNIFEQTENKEVEYSCNQIGSRIIEMLLPFAKYEVLLKFMNVFSEDIRPLSKDRFAGYVLEALFNISCQKSLTDNITETQREHFKNFTLKTSKFLLNNLEDYIWDNIGNHVIRTCLSGLVQLPQEEKKQNYVGLIKKEEKETRNLPEEYLEIAKEYGQRLIIWPQFNELCNSELTSGFLQVLLKAIKKADSKLLKKYLEKLLNENFLSPSNSDKANADPNVLPPGFMSTSLLMLLETALQVASKKMFAKYCEKLFSGRMLKLATMRTTNFAVQKVLSRCVNKEQFESFYDELAEDFSEINAKGHPVVLLTLAQCCKRLSAKQGSFVQEMMKSLNCLEPEERQRYFVMCMSRLTPYDPGNVPSNENLQKEKLSLQGTLMLQLMLEFNKPIKIVNSILSMDAKDLKNLFSNAMGSHIVDSFTRSGFVGEKSREKLVRKMKGTYQDLASSKHGSRSFEAIWNAANMKSKLQIMEELSHKDGSWSHSEWGKIIASKLNLVLFKRNRENWKNSFNNKATKVDVVLADVLK